MIAGLIQYGVVITTPDPKGSTGLCNHYSGSCVLVCLTHNCTHLHASFETVLSKRLCLAGTFKAVTRKSLNYIDYFSPDSKTNRT